MIRSFALIIFFIFCSKDILAQKTIVLNDTGKEFVLIAEYLKILEDAEQKWTIEDVSKPAFENKFILNKSFYPYNQNISSAYWIKFKVKNKSKKGKKFLLESYAPHTNDLQLYIPDGGKFKVKKSGIDLYFYDREYINKNIILDLPLNDSSEHVFYVRVSSLNHSSFDFRIKPLSYFFYYSINEYFFLGLFYGILSIMAIYNLLTFFLGREKVYLYYVFYVLSGMMTTMADDGIGYQYIWINYPSLNSIIGPHVAPFLLLVSFIGYSKEFLNLSDTFPRWNKFISGLLLFFIIYYVLKLTVLPLEFHSHVFYILPFIAVYVISVIAFIKGFKAAKFFIIGFTFLLVSIIIIKLRSNGSIEGNLFTVYSFNYGLVLEVLVLSFGLADRYRYVKKERERALKERNTAQFKVLRQLKINEKLKDKINQTLAERNSAQQKIIDQLKINEELKNKVNKELELKVAERTRELDFANTELREANKKLKELTDKANKMSIQLDIDNWELKKKVKEELQARISGTELSYEEFNEIFPNEDVSLRYLYQLKWNDKKYTCYKCDGLEYSEDLKTFGRKCLKCGYYESATAHTLFHNLKFPVNKAFYIAYIMINKKDRMTLDQLSILLNLTRNSCWKFKQKVFKAIESAKQNNNSYMIKSWEEIIFSFDMELSATGKRSLKK